MKVGSIQFNDKFQRGANLWFELTAYQHSRQFRPPYLSAFFDIMNTQ